MWSYLEETIYTRKNVLPIGLSDISELSVYLLTFIVSVHMHCIIIYGANIVKFSFYVNFIYWKHRVAK